MHPHSASDKGSWHSICGSRQPRSRPIAVEHTPPKHCPRSNDVSDVAHAAPGSLMHVNSSSRHTQLLMAGSAHVQAMPFVSPVGSHSELVSHSTVASRASSRITQRLLTQTPSVVALRPHSKRSSYGHTLSLHGCEQSAVVGSSPNKAPPSHVHDASTLLNVGQAQSLPSEQVMSAGEHGIVKSRNSS